MVRFGQQDVISYPLYLVGGCVVAFHLDQVHAWVCAAGSSDDGGCGSRRGGHLLPGR
jgi:hypothetical protein